MEKTGFKKLTAQWLELLQQQQNSSCPLCMGILNVTPDSFHDGGKYLDKEQALRHFIQLTEQGADIVDIGGMSSRPGYTAISVEEEIERVVPVIEACAQLSQVPHSPGATSLHGKTLHLF